MREIDRSLKRLRLDHIDLYLLHHFDPDTPLEETLDAMNDVVRQGKARYVGMCNYTAAQVVEALWVADKHGFAAPACLQNQYNLIRRSGVETELLDRCRQHGLGMMTYSPIAVGLLTGRCRRGKDPPAGSVWSKDIDRFRKAMTPAVDHLIATLIDVAAELGRTPAQVAFAWILDHPEVTTAMTGPDLPEHGRGLRWIGLAAAPRNAKQTGRGFRPGPVQPGCVARSPGIEIPSPYMVLCNAHP